MSSYLKFLVQSQQDSEGEIPACASTAEYEPPCVEVILSRVGFQPEESVDAIFNGYWEWVLWCESVPHADEDSARVSLQHGA